MINSDGFFSEVLCRAWRYLILCKCMIVLLNKLQYVDLCNNSKLIMRLSCIHIRVADLQMDFKNTPHYQSSSMRVWNILCLNKNSSGN